MGALFNSSERNLQIIIIIISIVIVLFIIGFHFHDTKIRSADDDMKTKWISRCSSRNWLILIDLISLHTTECFHSMIFWAKNLMLRNLSEKFDIHKYDH